MTGVVVMVLSEWLILIWFKYNFKYWLTVMGILVKLH
jgi:hypothetical protein